MSLFSNDIIDSLLLHFPHCREDVPSLLGYVVSVDRIEAEINLLTDWYVDELFHGVGRHHVTCPWSRVFCDVERFLENEPMEEKGMGFFYTQCDDGTQLRKDMPAAKDVARRYYHAHHNALMRAVSERIEECGICYLIDCHSFTDQPLKRDQDQSIPRPDICLGVSETNTPQFVVDHLKTMFEQRGFSVAINRPYSGTMIPQVYVGNDAVRSIMIEINRKLYMDVETRTKIPEGMIRVNEALRELFSFRDL